MGTEHKPPWLGIDRLSSGDAKMPGLRRSVSEEEDCSACLLAPTEMAGAAPRRRGQDQSSS